MIERVSRELGYPQDVVRLVYKSQFKFIISKIRELPLNRNMSREDFDKLKTNFTLIDIGKIYCIWDNIQRRKRYYECFYERDKRRRYAIRKAAKENSSKGK